MDTKTLTDDLIKIVDDLGFLRQFEMAVLAKLLSNVPAVEADVARRMAGDGWTTQGRPGQGQGADDARHTAIYFFGEYAAKEMGVPEETDKVGEALWLAVGERVSAAVAPAAASLAPSDLAGLVSLVGAELVKLAEGLIGAPAFPTRPQVSPASPAAGGVA